MSEKPRQGNIIQHDDPGITLPVRGSDLGKFISGLLGQPQSIEREVKAAFDIDHAWLMNLHEVINQRIHQQANVELMGFKAVVYFANRMKRTITSVEAFETYKELQQARSIGIQIEWSYLIQFPESNIPEKQAITFYAKGEPLPLERDAERVADPLQRLLLRSITEKEENTIRYRIDYTERTWGNDIENLMRDVIATASRRDIKNNRYGWMQLGLFFAVISCCLFIADRIYEYQAGLYSTEVELALARLKDGAAVSLETLHSKLLRIGELILTGPSLSKPHLEVYVLGFFAGIFLGAISLVMTEYTPKSFVVLTEKAGTRRKETLKNERRSVLTLIWTYIGTIASGIIASAIYSFFS